MKAALFSLFWLLTLLAGCATRPTTMQNIKGFYSLPPKVLHAGKYYEGSSVTLGDGAFTYEMFTDVLNNPALKDNPQHGRFTLDGCLLELRFRSGIVSHEILTQRRGRFLMWSPKDYEEYLRTGRVSALVLYQQPTN